MASGGIMPSAGGKSMTDTMLIDKLPKEINEMKIKDDKVEKEMEAALVDGNGTETGHIIVTTIGGKNGQPKKVTCAVISFKLDYFSKYHQLHGRASCWTGFLWNCVPGQMP